MPIIVKWDNEHSDKYVYEYIVYWKDLYNVKLQTWYKRIFANLYEAKGFAKGKAEKNIPLRPYIIKKVTLRHTFKKDTPVEVVVNTDWNRKYTSEEQFATQYFKVYKI